MPRVPAKAEPGYGSLWRFNQWMEELKKDGWKKWGAHLEELKMEAMGSIGQRWIIQKIKIQ